ncbi:MAG: mechanosensitive ion channel [Immundisolibacteraceae bacterium]|nr:mechanosensitive ion channel [Immundisolibacteraceae bacterium]
MSKPARKRSLLSGMYLCSVIVGGVAVAEITPPPPSEPSKTIAIEPVNDEEIESRLRSILSELEGLDAIEVESTAGVAELQGTVLSQERRDTAVTLAAQVDGVIQVSDQLSVSNSVVDRLKPLLSGVEDLVQRTLSLLPLLIIAAAIVLLFRWVGQFVSRREALLSRLSSNSFVRELLTQAITAGFTLLGLLVALEILDAMALVGAVLGTAGVVGIAMGFAFRDTIENYIAGILLSIKRPFLPNEHIQIDSFEGKVIRLTSRATILMNFDGNHIRIPNATVFKSVMLNFSRNSERRFTFEVGLGNDVDLMRATELAKTTLLGMKSVLDEPPPSFNVMALGDSNVVVQLSAWIDQRNFDFNKVRSEAIRLIKRVFDDNEFDMPEPIYRLKAADGPIVASVFESLDPARGESEPPNQVTAARSSETVVKEVEASELQPDKHIDEQIVKEQRQFEEDSTLANELE